MSKTREPGIYQQEYERQEAARLAEVPMGQPVRTRRLRGSCGPRTSGASSPPSSAARLPARSPTRDLDQEDDGADGPGHGARVWRARRWRLRHIVNAGIVTPEPWLTSTGEELCTSWNEGGLTSQTDSILSDAGILPEHIASFNQITMQDLCPSNPGGPNAN